MKYKYFLIITLFSLSIYSQSKDIYTIARNGTVIEMNNVLKKDKTIVNRVNSHGFSPLILACYYNNYNVVNLLIEKGADLNSVSSSGTALMAATVKGYTDIVRLLVEKNANLDLTDETGTTALMYAVQFKNIDIVKLLLDNKANKIVKDKNEKTAFEYAVFSNNEEIINLLK